MLFGVYVYVFACLCFYVPLFQCVCLCVRVFACVSVCVYVYGCVFVFYFVSVRAFCTYAVVFFPVGSVCVPYCRFKGHGAPQAVERRERVIFESRQQARRLKKSSENEKKMCFLLTAVHDIFHGHPHVIPAPTTITIHHISIFFIVIRMSCHVIAQLSPSLSQQSFPTCQRV